MDLRKHGLKPNKRLIKSNTQQDLRRRNIKKKPALPTLEERKAGGIYGFLHNKKKIDPLKAQIDFLCSGYVHNHGSGIPKEPQTSRHEYEMGTLQNIRKDLVRNVGKNRLSPITHKEFYYKTNRKAEHDKPLDELMASLAPRGRQDFDEISSDGNEPPVIEKHAPKAKAEYRNFMYNDTNSQVGVEDRYVSEMKEIGREIAKTSNAALTSRRSPIASIINKKYKQKSSRMTVFP